MLRYCESFDHIVQKGGEAGVSFDPNSPLGKLGWTSMYTRDLVVNPGKGRWGTNRLDLNYSTYPKRFSIGRSCSRVVLGIAFQPAPSWGVSSWVDGYPIYDFTHGPYRTFTVGFGYGTFENFRVNVNITTAQGNVAQYYDKTKYSGLVFSYTTGNGTGYPAIQSSPYVSVPFIWDKDTSVSNNIHNTKAFTFIEI